MGKYDGKITFPRLANDDSGMYECVAANSHGNIYQTAYLDVPGKSFRSCLKLSIGKRFVINFLALSKLRKFAKRFIRELRG